MTSAVERSVYIVIPFSFRTIFLIPHSSILPFHFPPSLPTTLLQVLETMSPLDFLSFRDYLYPASGFQSLQWRVIENTLGLPAEGRLPYGYKSYCSYLKPADAATAAAAESSPEHPSLFTLVEAWLERCPLLNNSAEFSWWGHYQSAVTSMLDADAAAVSQNPALTSSQREAQLAELEATRTSFESMFDEGAHNALRKRGDRRLSYRATQAALLITLYCDEPLLTLPHRVLSLLVDIDEGFTTWRHRHASMVHRMLGVKMGTGGSSGYHYLKATAERHRVFTDLCNLSTFLIPRAALPPLPAAVRERLAFAWDNTNSASNNGSSNSSNSSGADGVHANSSSSSSGGGGGASGPLPPFVQGYSVGIAAPSAEAAPGSSNSSSGSASSNSGAMLRCPVTGRTLPAATASGSDAT